MPVSALTRRDLTEADAPRLVRKAKAKGTTPPVVCWGCETRPPVVSSPVPLCQPCAVWRFSYHFRRECYARLATLSPWSEERASLARAIASAEEDLDTLEPLIVGAKGPGLLATLSGLLLGSKRTGTP